MNLSGLKVASFSRGQITAQVLSLLHGEAVVYPPHLRDSRAISRMAGQNQAKTERSPRATRVISDARAAPETAQERTRTRRDDEVEPHALRIPYREAHPNPPRFIVVFPQSASTTPSACGVICPRAEALLRRPRSQVMRRFGRLDQETVSGKKGG